MPKIPIFWIGVLFLSSGGVDSLSRSCARTEYEKCVKMADPLISDAHMIFPDNMVDIDLVCRKWTVFVDCIRSYIDNCFTEHRRQQFNQAVETSVDTVHQMCTSSSYQKEYLQHATCLKSTLTENRYCGRHYRHLAAQVQGSRDMARDDLCCSHHRFRECVLTETRRTCDGKSLGYSSSSSSSSMQPSAFSRQVLDKALSFLKDQCSDYTPNKGECIGYQPTSNRVDQSADELTDTTHVIGPTYSIGQTHTISSEGGSTYHETEPETPSVTLNPLTWIPSRDGRRRTTEQEGTSSQGESTMMDQGGTRSSYGRGVTWESTMAKDDLFKATHYKPTTEAWYPGNNINYHKEVEDFNTNNVEEPNQQGLSHFDENSAPSICINAFLVSLQILVVYLFI